MRAWRLSPQNRPSNVGRQASPRIQLRKTPPPPLHPGITFIFVSVTHMTVWTVDERSTVGSRICLLLVYLEAAVAALCFGGLMCVIPIN